MTPILCFLRSLLLLDFEMCQEVTFKRTLCKVYRGIVELHLGCWCSACREGEEGNKVAGAAKLQNSAARIGTNSSYNPSACLVL